MPLAPIADFSPLRLDISTAPKHYHSARLVQAIDKAVKDAPFGRPTAAFNAGEFGCSMWYVGTRTPRRDVKWRDNWTGETDQTKAPPDLKKGLEMFNNVPIPDYAVPAKGRDRSMSIYDRETKTLWEFWKVERDDTGQWWAGYGGRIDNIEKSWGYFPVGGTSASGLTLAQTVVTLDEAYARNIEHAMMLALPPKLISKGWVWPANRTDGNSAAEEASTMGMRIRLRSDVDLDALKLSPLARAIAVAAQKYGFIICDGAGMVAVIAEDPQRDQREQQVPDSWKNGPTPEQTPLSTSAGYTMMDRFPWDKCEIVKPEWGRP